MASICDRKGLKRTSSRVRDDRPRSNRGSGFSKRAIDLPSKEHGFKESAKSGSRSEEVACGSCAATSTNNTNAGSGLSKTAHGTSTPQTSPPALNHKHRWSQIQRSAGPRSKSTCPPELEDGKSSVQAQIVLKLRKHVPRILQSFIIVNLQHSDNPILARSQDLLPENCSHPLPQTLNVAFLGCTWRIQAEVLGDRMAYRVVVSGDLLHPLSDTTAPKQRFFANLELTPLVEAVRRSEGDVWRFDGQKAKKVHRPEQLDMAMDVVRLIHRDYFVLQPSDDGVYDVVLLSPSLMVVDSEVLATLSFAGVTPRLAQGGRFHCEITWRVKRRLYCLPLCGSGAVVESWLCFLLDLDLPLVW